MTRTFGAAVVGLLAVAVAQAHFVYLVPAEDGSAVKLVFSDTLDPDTNVNIEKVANTKLTVRDAAGKETPATMKKGDGFYEVAVPGAGSRVVYGVAEYGVLQKGDAKPFRLAYYPKAVLGGPADKPVGGPLKAEILTDGGAGKVRFRVLHDGKPVDGAEVSVLVPGSGKTERKAVKTDAQGYTEPFAAAGRYGVNARVTETAAGELAGKKYEETRHYATLVVDVK
ncbi:MAG: DUF4198 domain-containing protein [Gemmataceae bacterium]|nr:DUF4198 domain-containing protein [Gemmataceae bacterium]